MEHTALVRAQRRRQALEALEFEQGRTATLQEQLETIAAELDGEAVDAATFARMAPEDVELVRAVLDPAGLEDPEPGELEEAFLDEELFAEEPADEREELEREIARLKREIASSRRRQDALGRYLEALDQTAVETGGAPVQSS